MLERLSIINERYNFLTEELTKPEVYNDFKKMKELNKEKTSLEESVMAYKSYTQILRDLEAAHEMTHDPEMAEFAHEEIGELTKQKEELEEKINMVKMPLKKQLDDILQVSNAAYSNLVNVDKPVFLAQAGQDEMIEASGVYAIGKQLSQTDHEIHWYPNSTHVITVGKERHLFEADVTAFLSHIPWNEE